MEYDLLYKNAKYFSKYILPYYFVFRTKGGDIVIKVDESDFAHLVGKQHTTNEEIKRLNNGYFYQRVLDGNITFSDLLNRTSDDEKLSFKQEYINDKNDIFITIFELLISKINLKKYSINLKKVSEKFDCDYCHNQIYCNSDNEICRIDMLSIVGDIRKNLFYYNSIQKITRKSDLLHFERLSHVNVFEIKKIPKAEIEEYLITYRDRIMNSPRNVINKKNKLNKNSDFSKTTLKIVNSILIKNNLKIGIGRYGKGTLQVYKNDELIELRFNLNENPYSNEPKGIAEYIKSKYGD